MTLNKYSVLGMFSLALILFQSCNKDTGDIDEQEVTVSDEVLAINEFSNDYLEAFYLWKDNLSTDLDYRKTEDPIEYFNSLLYLGTSDTYDYDLNFNRNGDRWSFMTDDYQGLMDYYNGQRESAGFYMYAYRYAEGSERMLLVPAYVYADGPAGYAGLKRGDLIVKIDGQEVYSSNVNDLLSQNSYTLTLADVVNGSLVERGNSVQITKTEFTADPILKKEVFEENGIKIAYLVYNSFIGGMDQDLIDAFQEFKDQGVTELVLDLRYNGGGAVSTAINLASMIAPSSAIGEIFLKRKYNDDIQKELLNDPNYGEDFLYDKLTDKAVGSSIDAFTGTPLPNLNLSRVYVIGLENTASASELIINGLKPYMNVVTVGQNTHGKYTASITLQNDEYTNWAMQLIVFKSANADDESDYWNGFAPKITVDDNPSGGDFGQNYLNGYYEGMLASAISNITGVSAKSKKIDNNFKEAVKIKYFEKDLNLDMWDNVKNSLPMK